MAPNSSMAIDAFNRLTKDFLAIIKGNPALATNRRLKDSAKTSLHVAMLIESMGEDSHEKSCATLLHKLLKLMEDVYDMFKTTRQETLLGHKTIKTIENFLSVLESTLSNLCEAFEDNDIPVIFADQEKEIDELRKDFESVRRTLARRETRSATTSPNAEAFRHSTPEKKPTQKTSRGSVADIDGPPVTASPKEKSKSRTNTSITSPKAKQSSSRETRRSPASRKETPWLQPRNPGEFSGGEPPVDYESPEEDEEEEPEPRKTAGHSRDRHTNMGHEKQTHSLPPQGYPNLHREMPPNGHAHYYPQQQGPPRADTFPHNPYYYPPQQPGAYPSLDAYGAAMLFSQMRLAGGQGGQVNIDSGNVTGNVYENVGNHIVEYRDTDRRGSRESASGSNRDLKIVAHKYTSGKRLPPTSQKMLESSQPGEEEELTRKILKGEISYWSR